MKILIVNDDGIMSPSVKFIKKYLSKLGQCVFVLPDRQQSAISHAITLHRPLRLTKISGAMYMVNGTPVDCARLGIIQVLKGRVDAVLSGINEGQNIGDDVHYSGTVAAATEGCLMGKPSVAVSLAGNPGRHFDAAAVMTEKIMRMLKDLKMLEKPVCYNINIPDIPLSGIRGIVWTQLSQMIYSRQVATVRDPGGNLCYWIRGRQRRRKENDNSDRKALQRSLISITPLRIDCTDQAILKKITGNAVR